MVTGGMSSDISWSFDIVIKRICHSTGAIILPFDVLYRVESRTICKSMKTSSNARHPIILIWEKVMASLKTE